MIDSSKFTEGLDIQPGLRNINTLAIITSTTTILISNYNIYTNIKANVFIQSRLEMFTSRKQLTFSKNSVKQINLLVQFIVAWLSKLGLINCNTMSTLK